MLKNRNRGFTLIELLVVVAIIGLLIGLLVPALGRARNVAQQAVITNNLRQVTIAVQGYVVDNEYFPPSYVYA
ncbi:MAG: prepilin-type N-terminal cleavage/methylation domain-containing protein, partial [Planctomycetota bacterium]